MLQEGNLRQSILRTVAFFDISDYPMAPLEIWRFLYAPFAKGESFEKALEELEALVAAGKLAQENGLYFLPGRENLVGARAEHYAFSFPKYRKAERFAKLLALVPGVRMAALGNTMAWRNAKKDSDIDFFIVAAAGRIWSVRFMATALAGMLGLRPRAGGASQDAVCLSFFASEDALDLRRLMIPDDIYFIYWVASLAPLFEVNGFFKKFTEANNWVRSFLPNVFFRLPARGFIRGEKFLTTPLFLEKILKKIQARMFPAEIKRLSGERGSDVVISDEYLKFHVGDRRSFYRDSWQARCREIL